MSHFTVMVIGPNPEDQLAPYSEHIQLETPEVRGDVTEEEKQRMVEFYKNPEHGGIDLPFDELYEKMGDDWNSNSWVKRDDKWVEISFYNPLSKWDWYQLGGRWSDYLKLKADATGQRGERSWTNPSGQKDGYADAAKKSEIDFEGMRDEAGQQAGESYDKVMVFIKDTPPHKPWSEIISRDGISIDVARAEYRAQPRILALSTEEARKELGYFIDADDYNVTKEEYIEQARDSAISTFAILKDGKWYEKGKMGWWAMVSDEKEQGEWNKELSKMLDELSDDTMISIYDCHI